MRTNVTEAIGKTTPTEWLTAGFGLALGALLFTASKSVGAAVVMMANAGVSVAVVPMLPHMRKNSAPAMRFLGETLPMFVFYLYYRECGLLLSRSDIRWKDASLAGIDDILARVLPAIGSGGRELLAAGYMSYVPFCSPLPSLFTMSRLVPPDWQQ